MPMPPALAKPRMPDGEVRSWDESFIYARKVGADPEASGRILFLFLSPMESLRSVARCRNLAKKLGYKEAYLAHLFNLNISHRLDIVSVHDPVGPDANRWLRAALAEAEQVVCAWGEFGQLFGRDREVIDMIGEAGKEAVCFGVARKGYPVDVAKAKKDCMVLPYQPSR